MPDHLIVPDTWTRITDPELCWLAMVAAKEGVPFFFFGVRAWQSGGVDLFSFKEGRSFVAQYSLVGYVSGQRFVVVWRPQELDQTPEVYHAPR